MQFALSRTPDLAALATSLRTLDPRATVVFDADRGILDLTSSANPQQVLATLEAAGHGDARTVEVELHVSGGSTCCGGCS